MKINILARQGHLYLDYLLKGFRKKEALGLTIGDDPGLNALSWEIANIIKAKRERQLKMQVIKAVAKKWRIPLVKKKE